MSSQPRRIHHRSQRHAPFWDLVPTDLFYLRKACFVLLSSSFQNRFALAIIPGYQQRQRQPQQSLTPTPGQLLADFQPIPRPAQAEVP